MSLSVTTVDATRSIRPSPAAKAGGSAGVIVALALSVGVLVIAAWLVLSHLHH
jgi:hypothetical protein